MLADVLTMGNAIPGLMMEIMSLALFIRPCRISHTGDSGVLKRSKKVINDGTAHVSSATPRFAKRPAQFHRCRDGQNA